MAARKKRRINESKYISTAVCYLIRYPLLLAGAVTAVVGNIMGLSELYIAAIALAVAGLLATAIYLLNARTVICRLCRAEFLKKLRCIVKKNVPKFLGNVRIPVACALIVRKHSIHCPYCGERHPYFGKR